MKKDECNCIIGIQSTSWEMWEVYKEDFDDKSVDYYRDIDYYNYCPICGQKIDKEKYKKLIKKLIKEDEKK